MRFIQAIRTGWRLGPLVILVFILAVILALSSVLAQEPRSRELVSPPVNGREVAQVQPMATLGDDGGAWEVGVHHSASDLNAHATAEGWGLYWRLGACGWNQRYRYNNTWAWEEDFKRSAAGGKEYQYLDTVDLQFYVGHGGPGSFTFANTSHDDKWLTYNDCYRSWGNNDNDWVALTSCQVLADSHLADWAKCFYGTHLILGFKTNARAHNEYWKTQGYNFAKYLCQGYKVPQAWYKAADRSQPSGRIVRALINELAYLNDRPMCGASSCSLAPDSYDWDAWVQTHYAGSEPARPVDIEALQGTMPVYRFAPFSLDDADAKYGTLGNVFSITTTQHVTPAALRLVQQGDDPMWTDVSGDGRELEMDSNSGLYGFTDLNNLWTYTPTLRALNSTREAHITTQSARDIADQFLTNNGLMPGDAQFYEVVSDTISGGTVVTSTREAMNASLLANERPVVWQVIYSRILTYTLPGLTSVDQDPVEFSVIGPGAKQKVYVSTNSGVYSVLAGTQSPILGVLGGWRALDRQPAIKGIESVETVDILTPEQIFALHDELEGLVALNPPPIVADTRTIMTHTVAYWEEGAGTSQADLIPVYELTVSYTQESELVAVEPVYIPANETYMRPFARIESAPTEKVRMGQTVTFAATDATTQLSALGYSSILNFALGSGDNIYEWYANTIEEANKIGAGRSISYTVTGDMADRSGIPQQTIILKVTDVGSDNLLSTSASVAIDVWPRVFLPLIAKE